jgi:hypothetical protein
MVSMNIEDTMTAEAEFAELASTVRGEGLGVTPVKALSNNADTMVPIYHAITGHSHKVPYYMVDTNEGHSLLKVTFTNEDIRLNQLDPKWAGKRVWYLTEQTREKQTEGDIYCTFSVHQTDASKQEVIARGFAVDCRKNVKFATRYDMENHRKLRHPRRDAAISRYDDERRSQEIAEANRINAQALSALVELMKQQQAPTQTMRTRQSSVQTGE